MTVMAAKARGEEKTALECLQTVLGEVEEVQTAAKEGVQAEAEEKLAGSDGQINSKHYYGIEDEKRAAAAEAQVDVDATDKEAEDNSILTLCGLAICPCAICCCSTMGQAVSGEKLSGMTNIFEYITTCKDANAGYRWTIQNYHYETRTTTSTDDEGNTTTQTHEERVNTHYAETGGILDCRDTAGVFVPNTRLRNCALASVLDVSIDFPQYHGAKQQFYNLNTMDVHQETGESFRLDGMNSSTRLEWVQGTEDPWWASEGMRNVSALTCTAVCWFHAMKGFMGTQRFVFNKSAVGFA